MDFSALNEALSSQSFEKIADTCDNLMFQAAADGVAFQDDWPFAIHLLAHIYIDDMYCKVSLEIDTGNNQGEPTRTSFSLENWSEAVDEGLAGVYQAIRGFDWTQQTQPLVAAFSELYTKKMFQLLLSAYSTISIQDAAQFLGMSEDDATNYVLRHGWAVDSASQMLTVKKQAIVREQKLEPSKLQRLTEYVFHLEH